jgi:hypothetical protein
MKDPRELLDRLFAGLEPTRPPAHLRARVLALERAAVQRADPPDVWARLWKSRSLRLAWTAAILLLVLAHTAISLPSRARPISAGIRDASMGRPQDPELEALLRLPRLDESTLPAIPD